MFLRLAGEQRLDDLGVEGGTAAGDLLQGPDQLVALSHPFLQQITEAGDAVLEQLERVVVVGKLGEHDDADLGVVGADPLRGLDALDGWVGGILMSVSTASGRCSATARISAAASSTAATSRPRRPG